MVTVEKAVKILWITMALSAHASTIRYWVDPCPSTSKTCRASDPELAHWAMEAWQSASGTNLTLEPVASADKAQIRVHWEGGRDGLYGEARGGDVYIVLPAEKFADALMRETVVYLTCVHEIGHALGLAHTADFADIMYSFQYGGDITEYFARYRRKLKLRPDIRKNDGMSDADRKRLVQLTSEPR
jgi:hypothetical protein